jgi:hypothetical protein
MHWPYPTLCDIPTLYSYEVHSELLFDLCASLLCCGVATPDLWAAANESGNVFVQNVIRRAITDERIDLLERNLEYHMQIVDVVHRYGYDRALESSELAITINSGKCGYLVIGEALDALEQEEPGLGAAFYWQLLTSLNRVMRTYDHNDAFMHEEQLREWAAMEEEEAVAQYEFPEVEKGLPEYIRDTVKSGGARLEHRQLLRSHRKGPFGKWIARLQKIQRLTRLYPKTGNDLGDGYYDSAPLPTILIVFKENDVIAACFDEESQHMLEGSPEPNFSLVFTPKSEAGVLRTKRIVERFVLLNCELFQLVEDIQGWGQHGHRDVDRGELPLRAA